MKRRSFISLMGATALMRVPLWGGESAGPARPWGPPRLISARAEHERVVLSFTPVTGAESYIVESSNAAGAKETIEGVSVSHYSVQGLKNGTSYQFRVAAAGPQGQTAFSEALSAIPTAEIDWESLAEAFQGSNPTRSSCPFWMVRGNETEAELRTFMRVIYRFGFEGVTLHPYDYKGFLEENNWKSWRIVVDEARKLGLTVWEQDDKDYPCGYAGGKIVARNRKLARWEITLAHQSKHPGPQSLTLDIKKLLPADQQLVAVVAVGSNNAFHDLTEKVSDGELHWDVPQEDCEIFVHGAWQPGIDKPTRYPDLIRGEVRGYIDPLSPEATDMYVQLVLDGTCRAIGYQHAGKTWKGFYIDEPAFHSSGSFLGKPGGFPYTPDFFPRFERRYGYSLRPWLPLLWIEQGPRTVTVRHDYMDFVSTEYDRLFLGKQTRFAESHGMQINGHVVESSPYQLGSGTGSDFRMLESYSMGGFDNVFDQWYMPDEDVYWRQCKMASSVSHYIGTPLDEAMVEHFAATGWRTGLTEMKVMMDWTTCRGLNRTVPCGLDTADPPCWEDQPEFWLHGKNPLAPYFRHYQVAANRETMLIRGGRHVAKALILDTAASAWVGKTEELWKSDKALSQAHVDYDNVSYEFFTNPAKCSIVGNKIHLGREEYELVVLPSVDALPLAVAERLLDFYRRGGIVISLGPGIRIEPGLKTDSLEIVPRVPIRSADGLHDEEVKKIVGQIWGNEASKHGRSYIETYKDLSRLLYSLNLHDVWIDPNLTLLQYYHRRLAGRDLYFFNNEGEDVSTVVRLRGAEGIPELWDPATGRIGQAPYYSSGPDELSLHLYLHRYESVFVVLNPAAKPLPHVVAANADEVVRDANGRIRLRMYSPGTLRYSLQEQDGATVPKQIKRPRQQLKPLTIHGWSRTEIEPNGALYKGGFDWPYDTPASAGLLLSNMTQVVSVKLNGKALGMRFTYPFRFDLGPGIQAGSNEIEIEHIERYTYVSKLGDVKLIPYFETRV
ncbi:MAG TPA: glycosyl hydrolase [Terriglobia bacterium]|nr:glycosyl hydrolase [Terriglobia bacterium]